MFALCLGRRRAKNIPEPIDVYRVRRAGASWSAWAASTACPSRNCGTLVLWLCGYSTYSYWHPNRAPPAGSQLGQPYPGWVCFWIRTRADPRPSIAVMPFAMMSGGEQSYFADGLTEDVTTALARNPELQVIARDSTYAVRGQDTDVRKLGARLGVEYVVEGSARRAGDQLRVSAQLIEVGTGAHLWSRSFGQAGRRRFHRAERAHHGNRRSACALHRQERSGGGSAAADRQFASL